MLHDRMAQAGKSVRMEFYQNGYHDSRIEPQGHAGRPRPGHPPAPPPAVPRRWT